MLISVKRRRRQLGEAEHFKALVEATSDWVWEVDVEGRYTYVSPKVTQILGYEIEEVLGKTPFDFMQPAEALRVRAQFEHLAEQQREFHGLLNTNISRDGQEVILETSGVPFFDEAGRFCGYRGIDRDVTVREHTLRRLRLADAAVQHSAEGILVADAYGHITACNPAFLGMSGYAEDELIGRPPSMLSAAADPRQRLWDLLGRSPKWSGEGVCRHKRAEAFSVWMTLSSVTHGTQASGFVALISDMTERQLAEATIRFQASHDGLTQLANRAAWLSALQHAVIEATDSGEELAVLFIDLDGFKAANDRYGHGVGDTLLTTTARRLERCVRSSDLVSRFGGDEFTILLRNVSGKNAPQRVAEAVVKALALPFRIEGHDVHVSGSVGLARFPAHGKTADAIIAAADKAMYIAKRAGGSRVHELKPKGLTASAAAGTPPTRARAAPGRSASPRPS